MKKKKKSGTASCLLCYFYARGVIDPILATFGQICNFRDPKLVIIFMN